MISLNGVELHEFLQVPDLDSAPAVLGNERRTMGGRLVIQRLASTVVTDLTLTAVNDGGLYGMFTRVQVAAIRAMADTGAAVEFIYHDQTFNVVVPLTGIDVQMVGHRTDPAPEHPYVGTVLLKRVA